jgi:hypothetical protein
MNRDEWFEPKWIYLRKFVFLAAVGLAFCIVAGITSIKELFAGSVLVIPLLFWLVFVPLLHWKDRYRGERSTLWGALILIEASGWFKIVYWFRHVLPDWKETGRYSDAE